MRDTETVKRAVNTTLLHEIVVVRKGMETRIREDVRKPAAGTFPGFPGRK